MSETKHPKFEAFKRKLLANPDVRRGYIEAKVRRDRDVPAGDSGSERG